MTNSIRLMLTLVYVLSSPALLGQCRQVLGWVADAQTGEALPGASVVITSRMSGVSADSLGRFDLPLQPGEYVQISFVGYESQTLSPPEDCTLRVALMPLQNNLDEVVIKSERLIAEEFTIRKINKLDIYTNPSAKADPLLAVNASPAATTLDESANISLRGSSPAETGIFLNNVPINDAVRYAQLNGLGTFSIFNTALIRQVQVYAGNPPLEFGNTASGLISLQTDEVIPEQHTNTVSLSLASAGFYTQRKLNDNSSLTAFTNLQPSGAFRWVNPAATERLKQFNSADAGLHYFSKPGKRTVVKVFNYTNVESFTFVSIAPTDTADFNQKRFRNYTVANVRHRIGKGELSFNKGLSFSRTNFLLSTLDAIVHQHDAFVSANYQYFGANGELKTGISYERRRSQFSGTFPLYEFAHGEEFPFVQATTTSTIHIPEIYAYGKRNIGHRWIFGGGIRTNFPRSGKQPYLSAQANVAYKPSQPLNVILSAGQYHRQALDAYGQVPVLQIQTRQYAVEASYKTTKLEGSAALFLKTGERNSTDTHVQGLELFAQYRLNSALKAELSLTSLQARERPEQQWQPSPYNIHYFWRGNVECKWDGTWTASVIFLWRQGSYYNPVISARRHESFNAYVPTYGTAQRLPPYFLLDVSVSKLFAIGDDYTAVAFAGIANVPNTRNVRGYVYNFNYTQRFEELFSQRSLYFGVSVNF